MRHGWELTKKSWGVVRSHPGLIRLPIYGGLLALVCAVIFVGPGAFLLSREDASTAAKVGGGVLFVVGAYLASFFVIYFNVALAAAADHALRGEQPDLKVAGAVARSRLGQIAAWALVSALVSAALGFLRDRGGAAGAVGAGIGGAIWGLITFMVIPVLAFEGMGPIAAIRRSATLFRQRWGQQVTGNVLIGGVAGLIVLLGVAVGAGGVTLLVAGQYGLEVLGAALLLLGIVLSVAGAVFAGATRGVFGTALYRYIAEDHAVGPFSAPELESAVRTR